MNALNNPPTKMQMRELLSEFATGELYVVFSYDYDGNILQGMKITGDDLNLRSLLKFLRKHGIYIMYIQANPVQHEWNKDQWILWWDLLFFKYSTEN